MFVKEKSQLPGSGDANFIDVTNQTFYYMELHHKPIAQDEESQLSEAIVTICVHRVGHFAIDMNSC